MAAMEEEQTSAAIAEEEKEAEGGDGAGTTEEELFRFGAAPQRLYHFAYQFRSGRPGDNNFLKGVKWSPDGSCFLTCSDDNSLRLFYLFVSFFPFVICCMFPLLKLHSLLLIGHTFT